MAIKAGSIVFFGGQTLFDRLQTAGPGQVNVNRTKVYELGGRKAVGSIIDIPDLSFTGEGFDASSEMECQMLGVSYPPAAGTYLNPARSIPFDIISPFLPPVTSATPSTTVGSVAVPYLALESLSYKYGNTDNASQTMTLKGDALYYTPTGASYIEEFTGTNVAGQQVTVSHLAVAYRGDSTNGVRYALSVSLASGTRLSMGSDYTEQITGAGTTKTLKVTVTAAVPATDKIRVLYASDTAATIASAAHAAESATRPAAIRGRNIEVYVGGELISSRWTSVQSVTLDWKVTLDRDLEFSNPNVVSQDFEVPDVTGSIDLKPRDYAELYTKVATIAGVTAGEVAGPLTTNPVELLVKLKSPATGATLKQLFVPDARFNLPGLSAKVQSKLTATFAWTGDSGDFYVIHGEVGS